MSGYLLSVVIPTRNRVASVLRLLQDLEKQTLPHTGFEVLVVDDGSQPALELDAAALHLSFAVRVVRRDDNHGAHEARFAGLRQATGQRVLFLDDDLSLSPDLLAEHARVVDGFAMGPIRYHPETSVTPYQRWRSHLYDVETAHCENNAHDLAAEFLYICNSSAPTPMYLKVFEGMRSDFAGMQMGGDGFDESLMSVQLRYHKQPIQFLGKAVVFHLDDKTLAEACRERAEHGALDCYVMLKHPELRPDMPVYQVLTGNAPFYKVYRAKLAWIAPGVLNAVATLLTFAADKVHWLPAGICRAPMAFAYWSGVRSVLPSLKEIPSALVRSCTASQ